MCNVIKHCHDNKMTSFLSGVQVVAVGNGGVTLLGPCLQCGSQFAFESECGTKRFIEHGRRVVPNETGLEDGEVFGIWCLFSHLLVCTHLCVGGRRTLFISS